VLIMCVLSVGTPIFTVQRTLDCQVMTSDGYNRSGVVSLRMYQRFEGDNMGIYICKCGHTKGMHDDDGCKVNGCGCIQYVETYMETKCR